MIKQELGTAEVAASLDQFKRDSEYLMTNYKRWVDLYSECWVVVYQERLVSRAATFEEAASAARKKGVAARCVIEYISSEPYDMMLEGNRAMEEGSLSVRAELVEAQF